MVKCTALALRHMYSEPFKPTYTKLFVDLYWFLKDYITFLTFFSISLKIRVSEPKSWRRSVFLRTFCANLKKKESYLILYRNIDSCKYIILDIPLMEISSENENNVLIERESLADGCASLNAKHRQHLHVCMYCEKDHIAHKHTEQECNNYGCFFLDYTKIKLNWDLLLVLCEFKLEGNFTFPHIFLWISNFFDYPLFIWLSEIPQQPASLSLYSTPL